MDAGRLLVCPSQVPQWLRPLVEAIGDLPDSAISPLSPPPGVPVRESAVLILFSAGTGSGPDVLLIERAEDMRSHAGQPAFPGGATEDTDAGPVAVALREAAEETGLCADDVTAVATLPRLWIPPSGFAVTPVVALWHSPSVVAPGDPAEVAAVHRVAIAELADPDRRVSVRHPTGYVGPGFQVREMLVWGFTGILLARLLAAGGWEREWEHGRVVAIDDGWRLAERAGE